MPKKVMLLKEKSLELLQSKVNYYLDDLEVEIRDYESIGVVWGPVTKEDGYTVMISYDSD